MATLNSVVLAITVVLAGCQIANPTYTDEGSRAEHEALETVFADPLLNVRPEGTGSLVYRNEDRRCWEGSHEPQKTRTYELSSDGKDTAAFYKAEAPRWGWKLIEERPVNARAQDAASSLIFERSADDFTLRIEVEFGMMEGPEHPLSAESPVVEEAPSVAIGGWVEDASFCT